MHENFTADHESVDVDVDAAIVAAAAAECNCNKTKQGKTNFTTRTATNAQ